MEASPREEEKVPEPGKERQGQIYTWGFCTHGQLGLKETVLGAREYVELPTHAGPGSVLRDVELKAVACGHFHTVVVDVNGNVFAFGRNDRGQLGRGGVEEECEDSSATHGAVPRRLRSLARSIITSVTCGAFHCLARTADGAAMSWGWNKHGQLGRLTAYKTDAVPDFVREAKDHPGVFKCLTAGFAHSAGVLSSGQVLAWGSNEYGQLGVGSAVRHPEVATTPLPVPDVVGQQVAAGDNHLVVLTSEGQVFASGEKTYGRLGIGMESQAAEKKRAGRLAQVLSLPWSEDPTTERIRQVACGGATGAAISTQGRLFTWGGGVWGQLGNGSRSDLQKPVLVENLANVRQVDIAQDHMLAVCAASRSKCRSGSKGKSSSVDEEVVPSDGDGALRSSSLWAWGRRQLLPSSCCDGADPEAQCVPVEVPFDMLGCLGALHAKGAQVDLLAVCGGSHSIVVGVPSVRDSKKRYEATRCAWMSTVTGPGTKGGAISESLAFRIVSRDEEGRDEKVGGLRFCVWATPVSEVRARRPMGTGKGLIEWDKRPFDLQRILDCRNGTYDGAYIIRRPGSYFFHVRMLRPEESVDLYAEPAELSRLSPGEPVTGSPFRVEVESGPAFAANCTVQLHTISPRSPKRRRGSGSPASRPDPGSEQDDGLAKTKSFRVDASSEVVWDICAHDLFGNAVTYNADKFVASINRRESDGAASAEAPGAATECTLADSLRLPKVANGRSSAADEIREGVRQRKAEQIWMRMSSTFTQNLGMAGGRSSTGLSSPRGEKTPLRVKQSKDPGSKEIRWTPNAVGHYELHVALLSEKKDGRDASPVEEPIAGSPFEVIIMPGKPNASQSRLLVGTDALHPPETVRADLDTPDSPVMMSSDEIPCADVPIRLLLCDRMGNVCQESLNALEMVNVRIENVRLVGCEQKGVRGPQPLLESDVVPGASKGLLTLKLKASRDLLTMAAANCVCIVQFFVSASDRTSHQRLLGSPARVQLELPHSILAKCLHDASPAPDELPQAMPFLIKDMVDDAHELLQTAHLGEANENAARAAAETEVLLDPRSDCQESPAAACQETSHVVTSTEVSEQAPELDPVQCLEAESIIESLPLVQLMAKDAESRSSDCSIQEATGLACAIESPAQNCTCDEMALATTAPGHCTEPAMAGVVSAAFARVAESVAHACSADEDTPATPRIATASEPGCRDLQPCATQDSFPSQPSSSIAPPPPLQAPNALPSLPLPASGPLTCTARSLPTGEQEVMERRPSVQLPPLSPPTSQRSSTGQVPTVVESSASSSRAMDPHEAPAAVRPKPKRKSGLGPAPQSKASSRPLSWLPASGLATPDRRSGNQTNASARRRTTPLAAGLLRSATLTVAPSPWPQAR